MNLREKIYCIVTAIFLIGILFGVHQNFKDNTLKISSYEQKLESEFNETKKRLELALQLIYQNLRTITLLPDIRQIEGGNLNEGESSAVEVGRFEASSQATVQQIYNNLAANVPISEIYCVIDGLDYSKGETPFFMYDELVLQKKNTEHGAEEQVNEDFPEEAEDAEYSWFKFYIPKIQKQFPNFIFNTLDEIPAYLSPAMRTCDNTQYQSKTKDNEKDSHGLIMVVPFYSEEGVFRGVIAAIFRTNMMEAILVNRPFIPILDSEKDQASREGWSLPEQPVRNGLVSRDLGLFLHDRRANDIFEPYKSVQLKTTGEDFIYKPLALPFKSDLGLIYIKDQLVVASEKNKVVMASLGMAGIAVLIASLIFVMIWQKAARRERVMNVVSKLENIRDLSERLPQDSRDETGALAAAFNKFVTNLEQIFKNIKNSTARFTEATHHIDTSAQHISDGAQKQLSQFESITGSLESGADIANAANLKTNESARNVEAASLHVEE
ncbi:MAG: hypothetical protein ACD_73C00715G0003, partial [uncultured bacterium]